MKPQRLFISYSHASENDPLTPRWKAELVDSLKIFAEQNLIDAWDDEKIPGGYKWFTEISNAIREAGVAILLLTKAALSSKFILEHEFKPLSARDSAELLVIPILCENCVWKAHPWLAKLQIRPFEARSLADCSEIERAARWRLIATEIAKALSRIALAERMSVLVAPIDPRTSLNKFPLNGSPGLREDVLIGREQELALLDLAFAQPHTSIVSLVAWGGVGKTKLIQHWLQRLQREGWGGMRRIYAWSFYSQGAKEDLQGSEDSFLAHALEWFGVPCEPTLSPWEKGRLLAEALANEPTLLVLDGIEPLQYPPGPLGGRLRAAGIKSLLRQLARKSTHSYVPPSNFNQPLVLVTTREPLTDLADFQRRSGSPWGSVLRVDLGNLTDEAGAALLHHAGANRAGAVKIKPDDLELVAASQAVDGHALTLNLLARFLARAHGGNIRRRGLVNFVDADCKEQGGTTFRMLTAFEKWFAKSGEFGARQLAILRILGLFDRAADAGCIGALRMPPMIAGLTDPLFHTRSEVGLLEEPLMPLPEEDWNAATSFLCDFALILIQEGTKQEECELHCHPLIREYFAAKLDKEDQDAWRAAQERLYDHLLNVAPACTRDTLWEENGYYGMREKFLPSLTDLQPLYQALTHCCKSKRHLEASYMFRTRLRLGNESYACRRLGAHASDLAAVANFFEKPWQKVLDTFVDSDQAWFLFVAATDLCALGRIVESTEAANACLEIYLRGENWADAAEASYLLGSGLLILGEVRSAVSITFNGVTYADRTVSNMAQRASRAIHAEAMQMAGDQHSALSRYREAEQIRNFFLDLEDQRRLDQRQCESAQLLLDSVHGFKYCDSLLSVVECATWKSFLNANPTNSTHELIERCKTVADRAKRTFVSISDVGREILIPSLDLLTLSRIELYETILCSADTEFFSTNEGLAPRTLTLEVAWGRLDAAMLGVRHASRDDYLPSFLLTRAWLSFLNGAYVEARGDLDEAWEISERGPMRLHMVDIHLYRARLFFRERHYPWRSPQHDLDAAEKLISDFGYHRRDEEFADAKRAILGIGLNSI